MTMESLGRAVLKLVTDDRDLRQGLDSAEQQTAHSMRRMGARAAKVGAGLTAAVTLPVAAFGAASVLAYQEAERAVAGVEAALASMGPAAGRTSQQLQDMAMALQRDLGVDGDIVLGRVTANLLTFGNIAGEAFDRAQLAAINLSARLGKDLQGSAILVGRAINDPIRGVTALHRVGVIFTEQQREQIKAMAEAGNVAGAQGIILAELERQYGGQAAAMAATTSGQMNSLRLAWGEFSERIGEVIVKVLPPLTEALGGVVRWLESLSDRTVKWIVIAGGIAAVLGPVLVAFGAVVASIGAIIPVFAAAIAAVKAAVVAFAAFATGTKLVGLAVKALIMVGTGPIGLLIGAAAALTTAWVLWGDDIRRIFGVVVDAVGVALGVLRTAIVDAFGWVSRTVREIVDVVFGAFGRIARRVAETWQGVVDGAQRMYQRLVGNSIIVEMVNAALKWFDTMAVGAETSVGRMNAALDDTQASSDRAGRGLDQLARIGESAFSRLGERGVTLSGILRQVADDIARVLIQEHVSRPLGEGLGLVFRDLFGGLFGGPRAKGGPVDHGRAYMVGERGPELFVPSGSGKIVPHNALQSSGGGTYYIDARGADREGLARLESMIAQLHGSIEQRAVGAVFDARRRGGSFAQAFA